MILSTQTDTTARTFGHLQAVRMIAEAGFDAIDLSMFDEPCNACFFEDGFEHYVQAIKCQAKECGVYFNQAHAPFPTLKDGDAVFNNKRFAQVKRAVEIAGILEIKSIVVHPVFFSKQLKENNLAMYNSLLPVAKSAGVKIALENMWGWDDRRRTITKNVCSDADSLADYADALDPAWFTVCLDIGHIGLVGEYEKETILKLGAKRLTCVHIHDNDYRNDSHTAPFMGSLPWEEIAQGFAEIGYAGDLTLEADNFLKPLPSALYLAALRFMHDAGRELIRMIEEKK